ncbi:MAG TPA: ribokinase [Gemmatimonadaceae bacterium]|nr:ribokinase [Gemmatimonadaceae bacterium]
MSRPDSTRTAPRIVVVGSSNTDMVVRVPALPHPGETVLGGTFFTARGGKGANQAVAAARAGGSVAMIACLGDDAFGDETLSALAAEGIAVEAIRRVAATPSGVALILVDDRGENCIAVASGANALLGPDDVARCAELLAADGVLLVQLEIPLETVIAAARAARRAGARVILNPAPARELPDELLGLVSVLTPNESEAEHLAGIPVHGERGLERAASALLARGVGAVVVTLGAAGAYVATAEDRETIRGWSVEARDTTGAGDVFNGALAVALAEGQPVRDAVRFANAAAAISVTRDGAQPAAPFRAEILRLLGTDRAPADVEGRAHTSSSIVERDA